MFMDKSVIGESYTVKKIRPLVHIYCDNINYSK